MRWLTLSWFQLSGTNPSGSTQPGCWCPGWVMLGAYRTRFTLTTILPETRQSAV